MKHTDHALNMGHPHSKYDTDIFSCDVMFTHFSVGTLMTYFQGCFMTLVKFHRNLINTMNSSHIGSSENFPAVHLMWTEHSSELSILDAWRDREEEGRRWWERMAGKYEKLLTIHLMLVSIFPILALQETPPHMENSLHKAVQNIYVYYTL